MSDEFKKAIERIKDEIRELRLLKMLTMTSDYAWALEDMDAIIEKVEKSE